MEKLKDKNKFVFSIGKYLPVFVILLAISIMVGSTFAYFTDKTEEESTLTFSKVELSGETTTGINGKLRDVIPGTPLVDGALKFSKSIDSEAIYVRAKISFSLPVEYVNDNDMKEMVDLLRSATDFNIVSEAQNGAVWSVKDGNYFYLVESADATKLMRVDTIDTYTLSNEIVVPRDLKNLPDNAQYMKSVNFHVAFEAIQADNVSNELAITKEVFNEIFPQVEIEKSTVKVTYKGFDGVSNLKVEEVEKGYILNEPLVDIPLDANNEPTHVVVGWYIDSGLTTEYEFGGKLQESVVLYPLAYEVSQGLKFSVVNGDNPSVNSPLTTDNVVGYTVSKGTCTDTIIVVPNTYMGKPVVGVTSDGFKDMETLERIYLPNTIASIGNNAFKGCKNLILDELSDNVQTIGEYGFYNCQKIAWTKLPSNLTVIEDWAFNSCYELALTSLPSGITRLGGVAFKYCRSLQITALPDGLEIIDSGAFERSNIALTSLPNSVTSIASSAFAGCGNLALTSLPSGLTIINNNVFQNCTSLALTSLPSGITSIGNYAFDGCTSLALNTLSNDLTTIGQYAFNGCSKLALTLLPTGVTSVGQYAFQNCTQLALTELPSGLTTIERNVFTGCKNITMNKLPSGVTSIGVYAFDGCTKLALTSLPSGITNISQNTFANCENITINELPSGITVIGNFAFENCKNITISELPSGLTVIGSSGFYNCVKITISEIPSSVTNIGQNAFYGCTITLTSLPNGLTIIGGNAFRACKFINALILPSSITSIGNLAFGNCDNLNYILCETEEVATLVSGKGRADSCIYLLQTTGYESGAFDTEVIISDSVTIYTAEIDGYKWVKTSDNQYFKCIVAG